MWYMLFVIALTLAFGVGTGIAIGQDKRIRKDASRQPAEPIAVYDVATDTVRYFYNEEELWKYIQEQHTIQVNDLSWRRHLSWRRAMEELVSDLEAGSYSVSITSRLRKILEDYG